MKRILLLFSALMLSITALWAHDVYIDDIYYNLDETNKTAEVTYRGSSALDYSNEYIASYKIPSSITFESEEYIVTSIGDSAFYNCSGLTSVNMPNTITSIGKYAFYQCNNLQSSSYISNDEDSDIPTVPRPQADETTLLFQIENAGCEDFELYLMGIDNIWGDTPEMKFERVPNTNSWFQVTVPAMDEAQTKFKIRANGSWTFEPKSGYEFLYDAAKYVAARDDNNPNDLMMIKAAGGKVLAFKVIEFVTPCAETATYTITLKTTYCGDEGTDVGIRGDFPASNWSETIPMKKNNDNTYTYTIENGIPGMQFTFQSTTGDGSNLPIAWEVNAETGEEGWNNGIPSNKLGEETNIVIDLTDSKYSWSACISETRSAVVNEDENSEEIDYFIIPNSVKHIGESAFYNCTSLKKVNYLGTVDEWVDIDFEEESQLPYNHSNPTYYAKDLYINGELLTDVKITSADSIKQYAFYNCESIKSIEIGNSVTSIGSQAFYGCDGLKKVNYLGTIDEWVEIDFKNYYSNPTTNAKDLYINNELLTDVKITSATSVKDYVLNYCNSIETVEIGNSVTSIGDYAFYRCSSLASASIGENVTDMGEIVFYECNNLKNITAYPTKVPTINYYESSAQYEFGTYIAKLYVPCEALEDYELDNVFGQFKYIRCIEEEEAPEDVEIEVDDNGNVNIKWPPTEGANSYKLVVSHAGNVICTLQFNSKGQLTSIDLGKRSASVGFEFTVTGLSQGSKYSYEMTALSEVNEVLDYYAGAFITNGYKEDDDITTSINESITDANITVSGGTISADADFSIYNAIGLDVTAFNGSLQPGVYLVSIENDIVKVMVK